MSRATRSSQRKRQTTLTFNPLASSSPAASHYPQQIRDRAAGVSYEGSPSGSKRRRISERRSVSGEDLLDKGRTEVLQLPTPVKSSAVKPHASQASPEQVSAQEVLSISRTGSTIEEDIKAPLTAPRRVVERKRSGRHKQGKIDFTHQRNFYPTKENEPVPEIQTERRKTRKARTRDPPGSTMFSSRRSPTELNLSSDDSSASEVEYLNSSLPKAQKSPRAKTVRNLRSRGKMDSPEPDSPAARRTTRSSVKGSKSRNAIDSDTESADAKAHEAVDLGEAETSGDDLAQPASTQPRSRARSSKKVVVVDDDEDATDEEDVISPLKRKERATNKKPVVIDDDEDEEPPASSEESDSVPVTQKRRRLARRISPKKRDSQEAEDLEEDLEFLGTTSSQMKPTPRTPTKTATQKALEMLKKNRARNKTDKGEEELQPEQAIDTESDLEIVDESEIDEGYNDASVEEWEKDPFHADEEDEDFIAEDDEEVGSASGAPMDIPIEMTKYASMKAKELFKFAIEWMVQKRLNPGFNLDDDIYALTFRKLNDEVSGLVKSKFISSAWKSDFARALEWRPEIEHIPLHDVPGFHGDKCQACNRSGHPPSWEVRFHGNLYDPDTLEDLSDHSDREEDDDGYDTRTLKIRGAIDIPPENNSWEVGRFCFNNAENAHRLQHWRYHLYESVQAKLKSQGVLDADRVVERDRWNFHKRSDYANGIVDRWLDDGTVMRYYDSFRSGLELARAAKNDARSRR